MFFLKGEKSFFLQPGESLEKGIQNVYVLGEDEGLILKATEQFIDGESKRAPGDRWMIRGPREYVPPVEVEVCNFRKAIPLDANEGVYVRDIKTGTSSLNFLSCNLLGCICNVIFLQILFNK